MNRSRPEWGIAIRTGLGLPEGLREYGRMVRQQVIGRAVAEATAERFGILMHGGNGVIGALGAVALAGLPNEILFDPENNNFTGSMTPGKILRNHPAQPVAFGQVPGRLAVYSFLLVPGKAAGPVADHTVRQFQVELQSEGIFYLECLVPHDIPGGKEFPSTGNFKGLAMELEDREYSREPLKYPALHHPPSGGNASPFPAQTGRLSHRRLKQ